MDSNRGSMASERMDMVGLGPTLLGLVAGLVSQLELAVVELESTPLEESLWF